MPDKTGISRLRITRVGRRRIENVLSLGFLAEIELETFIEQLRKPGEFLFQVAGILLDYRIHGGKFHW